MSARLVPMLVAALVLGACGGAGAPSGAEPDVTDGATATPVASAHTAGEAAVDEPSATPSAPTAPPAPAPTATPVPAITLTGRVVSEIDGHPLRGATVTVGSATTLTGPDGSFVVDVAAAPTDVEVARPVWQTATLAWDGQTTAIEVALAPVVVRAVRVSREVAEDRARFRKLLRLIDGTTINALVFDTKDETDQVLYASSVPLARELGTVEPVYDPQDLLARAEERGLYTVTRIVTFEDDSWRRADPDRGLAGTWVDASDRANWAYPIELAVEACELGFDEVQFDYVRFPAGETAARSADRVPRSQAARTAAIAGFLEAARSELHPRGCGVSAAIFGIVMSSATDERLGQTPETISEVVDVVSPMLYPSHYSPGWLGFADPNDHPGPVIAHALDEGGPRVAAPALIRPWIQGFYYNGSQVQAQIAEAEARGAGWIIWNALGEYRRDWLPQAPSSD